MILYHGSFLEIPRPDLQHSRPNVDFGRGFYTTPLREQAVKWCGKFKRRGKDGVISRYSFDETASSTLKTLKFDAYSEEWLDFIVNCRSGKTHNYDIVIGPIADDAVGFQIRRFTSGLIDMDMFVEELKYMKGITIQYFFGTEKAIRYLKKLETL